MTKKKKLLTRITPAIDGKQVRLLISIVIGLITGIVSAGRGTDLIGLFLMVLIFLGLSVFLFRYPDPVLRNILFLAFVVRSGLALFQEYIAPLPDSTSDAVTFERLGWEVAQAWLNGDVAPQLSGAYLYSVLIGSLYYLFGRVPLVPQMVNVILGVIIVFLIYKLTYLIAKSLKSARLASLFAAFFPTLNLYSAITLRENVVVVLTIVSVYCFTKWLKADTLLEMAGAAVTLLGASALHGGMIVIGSVYGLFFCFYDPKRKRWVMFSQRLLLGAILTIVILGLFRSVLLNKLPNDIFTLFSPEYLGKHTAIAARDRAAYLVGLTPNSFGDLIIQTPIRMIYFLFTPFPWMVTKMIDFVGFIDAFLYFGFMFYSLKGLLYLRKRDKIVFVAISLILIIAFSTFAWGTSNYGTAIRHRQKFVWLLMSLASLGVCQSPWWRSLKN